MDYLDALKSQFNGRLSLCERRPGIHQVIAPLFHEDGDMVDIFIDSTGNSGNKSSVRVSDHGMTLMRLSYSYDIETPTKRKVLEKILAENGISEEQGRLYVEALPDRLYPALLQFAQSIAKVGSMQAFKREVIHSLFYETLDDFVENSLAGFHPTGRYLPLGDRDDLEVDWRFGILPRNIFLYAVKDNAKARLAALACLEFQMKGIAFRSVMVHEDFENGLSKKDQVRITNVADKQFTSFSDFQANAEQYFTREAKLPSVIQ